MSERILIRTCNGCGVITAFDRDVCHENAEELSTEGETVSVFDGKFESLQSNFGGCKCPTKEDLLAEVIRLREQLRRAVIALEDLGQEYDNWASVDKAVKALAKIDAVKGGE